MKLSKILFIVFITIISTQTISPIVIFIHNQKDGDLKSVEESTKKHLSKDNVVEFVWSGLEGEKKIYAERLANLLSSYPDDNVKVVIDQKHALDNSIIESTCKYLNDDQSGVIFTSSFLNGTPEQAIFFEHETAIFAQDIDDKLFHRFDGKSIITKVLCLKMFIFQPERKSHCINDFNIKRYYGSASPSQLPLCKCLKSSHSY